MDSARDRLLLAAAQLLDDGAEPITTRAICDRAGVRAPTLYHHFASKEGLLDAVVTHGFKAFLESRTTTPEGDDPLRAIAAGWDLHVRFGLEHPTFYAFVYGAVRTEPCTLVAAVEAMLLEALEPAARAGRLRVTPEQAAAHVLAASAGVTLTLINGRGHAGLADQARDAVLRAIAVDAPPTPARGTPGAAIALAANLLEDPGPLSETEAALLQEWLRRLASARGGASTT